VYSDTGKELGKWPALVSYPEKASDLGKEAETWVQLTFENAKGETATAFRKAVSPFEGDPVTEATIDPRLLIAPQLIETGLLMPARIPRIGFGNKSQSLYEAVKLLTGLDQLADVSEAARLIGHKAQPFLKYAKQQGADRQEVEFNGAIAKAEAKATELGINLSACRTLGQKDVGKSLAEHSKTAAAKAAEYLATLKAEIADGLDVSQASVRIKIKDAVGAARAILNLGVKTIPEFQAWAALKSAKDNEQFKGVSDTIADARNEFDTAVTWHYRQADDGKLRLKALAAQYYVVPEEGVVGVCPLCVAKLTSPEQKLLQAELAELKAQAEAAERRLSDVCAAIEKRLNAALPAEVQQHQAALGAMAPHQAYAAAALLRFAQDEPFKTTLVGIAAMVTATVTKQVETLPKFGYPDFTLPSSDLPDFAIDLLRSIHKIERLVALVTWWSENGQSFRDAWIALVQHKDDKGAFLPNTVAGHLATLEDAVEKAEPLDELSVNLTTAATASEAWDKIQEHQAVREAIAKALEPLKDLRLLVNAETARSISSLSTRIKTILTSIHLQERLTYENASLEKKEVLVEGSFDPGMRIDAALVANTSWLRAILWAFVLALREQTIDSLGENPFPLVVMDDPQTTFDPRNKRKWAEVLAKSANADGVDKNIMQLVLTTHEQQFFKFLVNEQKLKGQQGLIAAVNKATRVATVANGSSLERAYDAAIANNSDEQAHKYISDVRIYCEDLLKCIMRGESPQIVNMNLDSLKRELAKLRESSIAPYNRQAFIELSKTLSGGGGIEMKTINDSHHQFDGTIGVAQAKDVKIFWETTLEKQVHQAFQVYAQFEAFSGDSRVFTWEDTVVEFPTSHRDDIKKIILKNIGVAAAAKTGGKAGDGALMIKEWETAEPIKLYNHEIYRLAAGTLDPIAGIGDLLIVSNHATVTRHSLVVAAFGDQLLARRYNESESHPSIAILTGHTLEPHELPQPIIAPKEKMEARKIVGTIFAAHAAPPPAVIANREIESLPNIDLVNKFLNDARLFKVEGRSAEPIALESQYLITHPTKFGEETLQRLDKHLVVAVDDTGARYFKRLQVRKPFAILESLNPDGTTAAELLSLDTSGTFPKLTDLLEVVGILFELPDAGKTK
jgi:hypothetical protein